MFARVDVLPTQGSRLGRLSDNHDIRNTNKSPSPLISYFWLLCLRGFHKKPARASHVIAIVTLHTSDPTNLWKQVQISGQGLTNFVWTKTPDPVTILVIELLINDSFEWIVSLRK